MQHGAHHRGAARAGEHAPDPDGLTRPDGTPVAVEELLEPTRLPAARARRRRTGPARGASVTSAVGRRGSREDVLDPEDVVGRAYGLGAEGLALIRPDGYLGLVADTADPALVRRYLADTLHVAAPAAEPAAV